jgi:hypothetical protein
MAAASTWRTSCQPTSCLALVVSVALVQQVAHQLAVPAQRAWVVGVQHHPALVAARGGLLAGYVF